MNKPKYKTGDRVTCKDSEELEQPMEIAGLNLWFQGPPYVYYVNAKHKKKGNILTITLTEGILLDA